MTTKPQINVTIEFGIAEVIVVGCFGNELARDWFDPDDLDELPRSARWLQVPRAELYDRVLQARYARAVA